MTALTVLTGRRMGGKAYLVNTQGTAPPPPPPPPSALTANRYDILLHDAAGPPGTPQTFRLYPNGAWPGDGSKTLTLTPSNGTISGGNSVVIPTGGTDPIVGSWTPAAAGELSLSGTNTAGMFNPLAAPFNCFAASSGTARTIAASLSLLDQSVHQRCAPSGNPLGFSTTWAKGWGEVWITVSSIGGATDGLWVILRDATNGDTALSGWVQVHGPISGPGEVRVLLPAGPYVYHLGVSTTSSGANAVQLAQRFKVGHVAAVAQRSYECGLVRGYAYSSNQTLPTNYTKTATWFSSNASSSNTDTNPSDYTSGAPVTTVGWYVHDGVTQDPYNYHYGEWSSSGAQEWGRLVESVYGVCGGLAGTSMSTWGLDSFIDHDGTMHDGFGGTLSFATRGRAREAIITMSDWDGWDSNYPTESLAESMTRYTNACNWIATHFPSVAVISICSGASGWFGQDGSRPTGYTHIQAAIASQLEATNPMVVSRTNSTWNERFGGHATMGARVQYVRTGFRQAQAGELAVWGGLQTQNRGPTLAQTGTVTSTGLIRLPGSLNGGSALKAVGITFANPTWTVDVPTAAELASAFSVHDDSWNVLKISSAVINTANLPAGADFTIDLQMTSTPPANVYVNYACDFGLSNTTLGPDWISGKARVAFFADDQIDTAHGFQFGWEMRPVSPGFPLTAV